MEMNMNMNMAMNRKMISLCRLINQVKYSASQNIIVHRMGRSMIIAKVYLIQLSSHNGLYKRPEFIVRSPF